ncbi:amidohydrolase family protein [Candidatus Poribacteria bacterium]|nr:amidohydrolase family protein [Candidatus Poribacteria bacterium]
MDCDLLIINGKILDGTGAEAFDGNVAVGEGRIVAMGTLATASESAQVIDARGRVVSPGFIDVHTHADFMIASPVHHRALEPFVRQGITTMITGNCGASPAPINSKCVEQFSTYWDSICPREGLSWKWSSMAEFLGHLEAVRPSVNVAQLVGHGTIRLNVMGYRSGRASSDDLHAMRNHVRQALEEGAVGVSFGLGYVPGVWSDTDELIEVARDLPKYGGHITVHLRGQTRFMERAVDEMIHVAEAVKAPLQLSHYVPFAEEYIDHFFRSYEATEQARARGVEIGYDLLPYGVASTTILGLYPPWMFEGGLTDFFERLEDKAIRERLVRDFKDNRVEWPTWETGTSPDVRYDAEDGWSNLRVFGFRQPEYMRYEGVNLEAIAEDMGKDSFEALFDLTVGEKGRLYYTIGAYDDDGIDAMLGIFLKLPHMSCMTDAVGIGHRARHPSHYGAFPKFIGRHVREWETFTLAEAVRKCTSLPASQLGLKDRGIIREGAHADFVIFDPAKVADEALFAIPYQYPVGIDTVIINGVPAWHENHYATDSPAGQVIKRA